MRCRLHFIIIYLLFLAGKQVSAQKNFRIVNREMVEQLVNDASLATFYPSLLDRFNAFDTTLTPAEYRLLYFGFVFQPTYSANASHQKRAMKKAFRTEKYTDVMRIADKVLQAIPVSLAANYYRAYAMLSANELDPSYMKYTKRYSGLRDAILSSGDGQRCNSAFKTIFVEDEYEIMYNYFEIDHNISQSLQYPCDRFSVPPSGTYQKTEIYFDTSESMISMQKELNSSR